MNALVDFLFDAIVMVAGAILLVALVEKIRNGD